MVSSGGWLGDSVAGTSNEGADVDCPGISELHSLGYSSQVPSMWVKGWVRLVCIRAWDPGVALYTSTHCATVATVDE
ncbi:hypothetical protein FA13DRAFT_1736053 [Coprinellus micaceus]|uniref:Uncharacterized protein n=1 Tax=Coprinellus micaceus TaxID=71717 RepID=A0A4Y7T138_COPMI|nr:hypothetical protein FA13DRAFT_1736053 [Coprinellus micaceus]